ncbi:MAG: hypothetical protein Q8N09_12140 [Thermodesulfovibrionia bacterium]|nr:hypothetical protein [Thermodesulfovibrionia bacterium]
MFICSTRSNREKIVLGLLILSIIFPLYLSYADNIENTLSDKWTSMINYLKKGDTQNALRLIHPDKRAEYEAMFKALGTNLKIIVSTQIEFNVREITNYDAKFELVTNEGGTTYSYEVTFLRDQDGKWWIYEF